MLARPSAHDLVPWTKRASGDNNAQTPSLTVDSAIGIAAPARVPGARLAITADASPDYDEIVGDASTETCVTATTHESWHEPPSASRHQLHVGEDRVVIRREYAPARRQRGHLRRLSRRQWRNHELGRDAHTQGMHGSLVGWKALLGCEGPSIAELCSVRVV